MSDSVRPHRQQLTRLPRPWDSPGKNTGVGCHFLLQCMKAKIESEVSHLPPTPSNPMDCSRPGSSIHGILQARVLEWGAIALSTMQYYSAIKRNKIKLFATTWMQLEIIIISEGSQKEKDKYHMTSLICGISSCIQVVANSFILFLFMAE